ncbi:tRNA delta(2)-isopentenylpyrophosphate transferase [Handroanthus impetiginosus]|uniref:tRNA delta(2)-isopentenylpyrophosphate transferase n=1 Tax=Handroanthus impetiginosus TaxID=429701 RepID=A0A2G9HYW5_9LAMI|nr:tRNA delta(2)-isopentenylpyrophosphate transferase [Handroanthus impetiginosus]
MRRLSDIFTKSHHFPRKKHHTSLISLSFSKNPSSRRAHMTTHAATPAITTAIRRRKKIVVIMGATGCGKSKLSVDLASRFFPASEIINSDKIQVYRGLDATTNKIPLHERKNVRHHLLGEFDSSDSHPEFTPSDFRSSASSVISQIHSRRSVPFIVGGSNSFIYALLSKKFNPESDVFSESNWGEDSVFCKEQRYSCCFLWVDVSLPVLNEYLVKRVDDMLESGMFEELAKYFENPASDSVSECGLKKAIGVPEFEKYFKRFKSIDDEERSMAYEEAVRAIKDNTCQLAKRQVGKILRLRDAAGWDLKRVDATEAVRAAMDCGGRKVANIWEKQVAEPSMKIVKRFLME